jgi:hypothetical protein
MAGQQVVLSTKEDTSLNAEGEKSVYKNGVAYENTTELISRHCVARSACGLPTMLHPAQFFYCFLIVHQCLPHCPATIANCALILALLYIKISTTVFWPLVDAAPSAFSYATPFL